MTEKKPELGPLARRLAALNPKPEPKPERPKWLERLTPRDMTGALR